MDQQRISNGSATCSKSRLIRILCPISCLCSWFIGRKPRNSWHTFTQSFCVMVTSPCGMWKVWSSGRHHSTKAVIRPWSISLPDCLRSPSKPSALMMSMTRSSTIGSQLENSSVRPRQVRDPRSCTKRNHGLIYDSKCIYIVWIKCIYIR